MTEAAAPTPVWYGLGKVIITMLMAVEGAWILLGVAAMSTLGTLDGDWGIDEGEATYEPTTFGYVLAAILLSIPVFFVLGAIAAWLPRLRFRSALVGVSLAIFLPIHLAVVLAMLVGLLAAVVELFV